ncbi:LOW QUALITY PROTEIN: reticulon-3 [Sarcoramphus papa]
MHSFTNELLSWDLVERNGVTASPVAPVTPGGGGNTGAEADSSGDSDDTVIEEAPVEDPPVALPRHRPTAGVTGIGVTGIGVTGITVAPPSPPLPESPPHPSARDWEEERLTLRALRNWGAPRDTPNPRDPAEPPPGTQLLPCLAAHDLLFWRDVKKTGVVFGASLLLLLSLATLSPVSVVAHLALALLSVTISLRVYSVVQAVQKSEEGHPFGHLELDVTLSPETFQAHAATVALHLNQALRLLLRLFLVEDLVDSMKLAMSMWLLTYVGAVFNGITLLILAELLAFTLPPLYEKYKVQIDHYVGIARHQTKDLVAKIQAKLPGLAKKKPE